MLTGGMRVVRKGLGNLTACAGGTRRARETSRTERLHKNGQNGDSRVDTRAI